MRTYQLTSVAILLLGWTTVCSQNFESGLPYSKTSFCPEPIANAIIPSKIHTGLSTQALLQESINDPNLKNRFSVGYAESINLTDDGLWSVVPNGDRIWRQQITATDALGLTVYFNHFELDVGSELFVYDNATGEILWSYGHTDNRSSFKKSIRFPMETVILELYELAGNESQLSINRIGYQYEYLCDESVLESCYQDVLCADYSAFSEVSNAVVRILVTIGDNEYGGTAAFINNSCNDGRPLLLTNHHNVKNSHDDLDCDVDSDDQAQLDYAAIVLKCVRPSSDCNDNEVAVSDYQVLEGLEFVAQCAQTDMALVEYDGTIPDNTNFYLAGWDASGTITDAGSAIIHHTFGFPKKISVASVGVHRTSLLSDWDCIPSGTDYYDPLFGAEHSIWDMGSGSPLILTSSKAIYAVFASNGFSGSCDPYVEYTNTCLALDEAFQQCGFGTSLSPEDNAIQSHGGMWFSDRENTCAGEYWGSGGTGSGGTGGYDALECINENPYNNDYAQCSWNPDLHQAVTIRGREFIDATRNLKAQHSITSGLDNNGNGVRIAANSDITIRAYHYIDLADGFVVEEGGKFLAETRYCCLGWDGSEWRTANPNAEEDLERPRNTDLGMPLGLEEHTENRGLEIYPNPNSGTFTISGTDMQRVQLMEASGKLVWEMEGPFGNEVEVSGLNSGLYIVRVQMMDGRVESAKVVVH